MEEVKPFRERLTWDTEVGELRDGEVRYLLIRPDTLMGMFALLEPAVAAAALAALGRSTAEHGRLSAARYREMGADDSERLIATIEATAPQLGWGRWRLAREGSGLSLVVANSPFAAGHGPAQAPVCAPIAGMLAAVAGLVAGPGARIEAHESTCAAQGAPRCRFHAAPA
jgi:predicted hydrocarbon binding protein